jgi:hypothetical protein
LYTRNVNGSEAGGWGGGVVKRREEDSHLLLDYSLVLVSETERKGASPHMKPALLPIGNIKGTVPRDKIL